MTPIKILLLLFAIGAHAADMNFAATAETSVEHGAALIGGLESAGLSGIPKDELVSAVKHMQPDHSFLLEKDVTMDGGTRTVQFVVQKLSGQRVEFSIISYSEKFAERLQSMMNSIDLGAPD